LLREIDDETVVVVVLVGAGLRLEVVRIGREAEVDDKGTETEEVRGRGGFRDDFSAGPSPVSGGEAGVRTTAVGGEEARSSRALLVGGERVEIEEEIEELREDTTVWDSSRWRFL
jgi:hypothetical protein